MMKVGEYKVIDDYFPDWMIQNVRDYMCMMPVRWDNVSLTEPTWDTSESRFMGNMILIEDNWQLRDVQIHWFLLYLIDAIKHDICKELNISNVVRCLHNGQFPLESMNGGNHRDSDVNNDKESYLSVIYMGYGNSGDCVIVDEDNHEHRVSFKEGRLVLFNSNTMHRGEAPETGYRCSWGLVFPTFDPTGIKFEDDMFDPNAIDNTWYKKEQPINH